ncbi:MAG: hypothetical protein ACI9NT_002270 [Bacteroidia bacterium]|jgi:hypothetical protein
MPTEKRPNLFLVGAQKCGTSALSGWLGQHPQVLMSFPKEPGFLAFGENGYPYLDGQGRPAPASRYVVSNEKDYLALFARARQAQHVIGEASTWYLSMPGTAEKIRQFSPNARIIIMLRDPVARAYSAWCHARSDMLEPCESFAESLACEASRSDVEFLLRYRQMGLYSEGLAQYQTTFAASKVLILFHEDLKADPGSVWRSVAQFLDINADIQPDFQHRYNSAGLPRSRLIQKLLHSHRLKTAVRQLLPHNLAMRVKAKVDDSNLAPLPPPDEQSKDQLKAYFQNDVRRVEQLTGRDLREWLQ